MVEADHGSSNFDSNVSSAEEARICSRIRELRLSRNLSLNELGALSGFSTDYLEQIENSKKAPPFAALARLGRCLGEDLSYFFVEQPPARDEPFTDPRVSVVRSRDQKPSSKTSAMYGFQYSALAYKIAQKKMEPLLFNFAANTYHDRMFEHPGDEFVYVIEGRLKFEIEIDGRLQIWMLSAGDSFYFRSELPHRCFAVGVDAKVLMIVSS
jgi:transcriptional regulator with XRE-family HTH domain